MRERQRRERNERKIFRAKIKNERKDRGKIKKERKDRQ
jgi:hypothetical protein